LTPGKDDKIIRMTQNLKKVKAMRVEDATVMDFVNIQGVIASKGGVEQIEKIFNK